jgi:predicted aspartyl protease
MLQIETANLPPHQQRMLDPDFLANEQMYLRMRAGLLAKHRGHWVAIDKGQVVAAGPKLMEVMEAASVNGGHPYIALLGGEDAVVFRVRRAVFPYDASYQPFALPRLTATFWNHAETHSQQRLDVIPDTGADVCVLPDTDCKAIDLFSSHITGLAGGVVGGNVTTLFYQGKVEIDGARYSALIQPIPLGKERIIGRDVLNNQRVLFDGPKGEVVIDP